MLQRIEGRWIAEEVGDADQQVLQQRIELLRLLAQTLDEIGHLVDLQHLHAPLHPARHGLVLVAAEVVAGARAQQRADLRQMVGRLGANAIRALAAVDAGQVPEIVVELGRDLVQRQHEVDHAAAHGAAHHAVIFGAILRHRESALFLDGAQAERAVAAGARQDDAGGAFAVRLGERYEKAVDRRALEALLERRADLQAVVEDRQRRVGRYHIDVVGLDGGLVGDLDDWNLGHPREKGGEHALAVGIEVLDHDISQARARLEQRDKRLERADAACGCADADDRYRRSIARRFRLVPPSSVRFHVRRCFPVPGPLSPPHRARFAAAQQLPHDLDLVLVVVRRGLLFCMR